MRLELSEPFVDLDVRIETPENVLLSYQLAGPAIRCAAYLVDLLLRLVAMWVLVIILTLTASALPGMSMGLILVLMFVNEWGYFTICETFFRGKSLGKHAFGLRVIHDKGYPITFWASALRNLVRAVDAVVLYGIGLVTILLSPRLQRLGDLAARTIVIAERRVVLPREPVILERIEPLARAELGSYVPPQTTLAMIDEFLGRRHVLSLERGHALALPLAKALAAKLNFQGDRKLVAQYPMAFLARVYVTFLREQEDDADRDDDRETFSPRRQGAKRPVAGGRK